jgi:hypothetical protein
MTAAVRLKEERLEPSPQALFGQLPEEWPTRIPQAVLVPENATAPIETIGSPLYQSNDAFRLAQHPLNGTIDHSSLLGSPAHLLFPQEQSFGVVGVSGGGLTNSFPGTTTVPVGVYNTVGISQTGSTWWAASPPMSLGVLSEPGAYGIGSTSAGLVGLYGTGGYAAGNIVNGSVKVIASNSQAGIGEFVISNIGAVSPADLVLVVVDRLTDRIDDLLGRIEAFLKRQKDWDGRGGIAPNSEAAAEARAFLKYLLGRNNSLPQTVHSPGDGEIAFQWRRDLALIEVAFNGSRSISWYAEVVSGHPAHGDQLFEINSVALDERLNEALRAFG